MNQINERIKHAETIYEVEKLLQEGKQQLNASSRILNRREKIAFKRIAKLRKEEEKVK